MIEEWATTIGDYPDGTIYCGNMVLDNEGNSYTYYMYPPSRYGYKLVKFDNNGLLSIQKDSISPSEFPAGNRGNALYYKNGFIYYTGVYGVTKYDKNLNVIWQYNDTLDFATQFCKTSFDSENNMIVSYPSPGSNASSDEYFHVKKIDSDGNFIWEDTQHYDRIYQGYTSFIDRMNNFYVTYTCGQNTGADQVHVLCKYSPAGLQWKFEYYTNLSSYLLNPKIQPNGEIWASLHWDNGPDSLFIIDPINGNIINKSYISPSYPLSDLGIAGCYRTYGINSTFGILKKNIHNVTLGTIHFNATYSAIHYYAGYFYAVGVPQNALNQIQIFKVDTNLNLIQTFTHSYNPTMMYNRVETISDIDTLNHIYILSSSWGFSSEIYRICQACKPNITGSLYNDENQNCSIDTNENKIPNQLITINPGPHYTFTNNYGSYKFHLADGIYKINPITPPYWQISCNDTLVAQIDSLHLTSNGNSFGLYAPAIVHDKRISMAASQATIGVDQNINIRYCNAGTIQDSGTVEVKIDPAFQFISSSPLPDSIAGNNIFIWKYDSLKIGECRQINITTHPKTYVVFNYPLIHSCIIQPIDIDSTSSNNYDTIQQTILSSYDPNDKSCIASNTNNEGYITDSSILSYLIRFQNTGNDTAIKIIVIDTLDNKLDLSTFQMVQSTHNYELNIIDNKILKWTFNNILLPDSHSNMALSNGFIKYSISPVKNLTLGSVISNSASIYFDFNLPVKTNTTLNYYELYLTIKNEYEQIQHVKIYPNPFKTNAHISTNSNPNISTEIIIYDLSGRIVLTKIFPDSHNMIIEKGTLSNGMYIVDIRQNGNRIGFTKFVIQ